MDSSYIFIDFNNKAKRLLLTKSSYDGIINS